MSATPGPWKVDDNRAAARVVRANYVGRDGGVAQATNLDDAALIAQAPALVESCEALSAWLERALEVRGMGAEAVERAKRVVDSSAVVIAAARGVR